MFHYRQAACAALLATTCLTASGQALAQEYFPPAAPPIRETIDTNGVDLARGALVSRSHSVAIGGPGVMGLGWSRTVTSAGDFRDSTAAFISVSGSVYTVSIGNGSESFTLTGANYVSNEKTGATLTKSGNIFTFTTRGGTIYSFSPWGAFKTQYGGTHRVTTITFPTGERLSFNYLTIDGICVGKPWDPCSAMVDAKRLESVKATNGYELDFDYAEDYPVELAETSDLMEIIRVTARNSSVDPASQSWPTLDLYQAQTFTDSLNRTTTYSYTAGSMTGVKRPGAAVNSTTFAYSSGRISQVVNEGVTTNYAYSDASGVRTTTVSDTVTGNRVVKTNLTTMLVTSDTDELGKITAFEYYPTGGLLKKVTAPELNTAEFEYDARGNRTKVTLNPKPGSGLSPIVTSASYPASDATETWRCATGTPAVKCNKPVITTDAKGNVSNYEYDSATGELTKTTAPAATGGGVRPEARYSYTSSLYAQYRNGSGVLVNFATPVTRLTAVSACQTGATCNATADEVKSTIAYGTANVLPLSVSSGSGDGALTATTAFTYDAVGNRLTVDGPLAGTADTSRTRFNAVRQVIGVVGPDPDGAGALKHRARRMTYNLDGQVTKAENGTVTGQSDPDWANFVSLEAVETGYDANARPVTAKLTAGGSTYALTQTSYDAIGRTDCTATRMNPAIYGSLPAACTLGTQGSAGPDRISKMTYDAANQRTKVTTAFGTADAADEVTATYTDNGKVATVKDAENNLTTTEYDGFDRVAKTRFPLPTKGSNASSTTDYTQPTYDAASNVTALRLRDGQSIALTYDNLNRVTAKNLPGTEPDVSYAYDNLNRLTSASQTGNTLSFSYDALSRNLTQVGPQGSLASQWDLAGRRTKLTYPGSGLYVDYDYLVTGDMTNVRENGATSGVGVLGTYAYDDLGRRTSRTLGNGVVQAFGFDPVSRLASLSNDVPGGTANDLAATFAYNPASQVSSNVRTGDAYAWTGHFNENKTGTANGLNQLTQYGAKALTHDTKGNVTAFGTKSFTYTSENLLLTGPNSATLAYDPAMRLYQLAGVSTTTRFAYDGLDRIAEHDGSNALLRRYVHGPGMDEPIVWYEGSGTTDRRFLSADERGSIISVTDSAGAVLALNKYDEFGQPQAGNLGAFGYTGQAWLPELEAWYYKARVQEPELGRFLQPDPIGYDDGMNLYAYVRNDPVNLIDPLGLTYITSGPRGFYVCEANVDALVCALIPYPFTVQSSPRDPRDPWLNPRDCPIILRRCAGLDDAPRPKQNPPTKPNKLIPCSKALNEQGAVVAVIVGFTFTPGIGPTGYFGSWKNVRTGTHGNFVTAGGQIGLEIGGSAGTVLYESLNSFAGWNVNLHGSIPFLAGGVSFTRQGQPVGVGVAPGSSLGAGAGVSATYTELNQCRAS